MGLRALSSDMREKVFMGLRPMPRPRTIIYGASPQTPLGDFSPQKSPRPEKNELDKVYTIKHR